MKVKRSTNVGPVALLVGAAVLQILLLGACIPRKAAPAAAPEKIRLFYSTNVNAVLVYVALSKGYFTREGLEVEAQGSPFGKVALQAVLDGKADIATVADTPFAIAVADGKDLSTLASIQTSNRNEALVADRGRGIARPEDLRGKRIGVTLGTSSEYFNYVLLLSHGLGPADVRVVDLTPADMPAALLDGRVDAVSTWSPTIEKVERALGERALPFYEGGLYTETMLVASWTDFADRHPAAVRRFLRALVEAERSVREHPSEAQDLAAKVVGEDRGLVGSIWGNFDFRVSIDQGLLIDLEDQTRWYLGSTGRGTSALPDYLAHIDLAGLEAVDPSAIAIIR